MSLPVLNADREVKRYQLHRAAWGRGLATERARATLCQAFSAPEVDHVVATMMAVNVRSRAVLERIG